jgi:hypothetical protein
MMYRARYVSKTEGIKPDYRTIRASDLNEATRIADIWTPVGYIRHLVEPIYNQFRRVEIGNC